MTSWLKGVYEPPNISTGGWKNTSVQVKGQEFPAHEPRGKWGVALGYAVAPIGADHIQAAHDPVLIRQATTQRNIIGLMRPISAN